MKKYALIAAALLVTGIIAYVLMTAGTGMAGAALTGRIVAESAPADDMYKMFLCPCCNQALDKKNVCCGMAEEMIKFIDSQLATGIPKDDVAIKTAEKYGINSVAEPKRELVKAEMRRRNPDLFPDERIAFGNAIGQKAPDFTLQSISGSEVKLSSFKGKNVILFFNEGSMCYPSCWDQIAALGNDKRLSTDDTVALSITPDQRSEWLQIVQKMPKLANATILFDPTRAISSSYDVLNLPSSMHKGSYPGHTYMIIDANGIIRYTYDDPRMGLQNERLFAELEKITG